MNERMRSSLNKLAKAIRIIANICKVCCIIGAVCVALCALVVPFALNNIKYENNKITVFNQGIVNVTESEKGILLDIVGSPSIEVTDPQEIAKVKDFLNNCSDNKTMMIVFTEIAMVLAIAVMVVAWLELSHLAKLFKNIENEDKPFTLDNVTHIRKIAMYMIILIVLPAVAGFFIDLAFKTNTSLSFDLSNVIDILFLYAVAIIFEYGYSLEKPVKEEVEEKEGE